MPLHVSSTCAHHQEAKIALQTHAYRHMLLFVLRYSSTVRDYTTFFDVFVLIMRRSKLHYTASGIITPIGVLITRRSKLHYTAPIGVLIIRRSKLRYTASSIITPIGVMILEAV